MNPAAPPIHIEPSGEPVRPVANPEPPPHHLQFLSQKELAKALRRSPSYVKAMKRRGFRFIAGRATLSSAILFLQNHPNPCQRAKNSALVSKGVQR